MDWNSLEAIRALPKVELHAHLGGCIPTAAAENLLREFQICGAVPSLEEHPIFTFIEYDVPFVLCTDNPGVHAFSLSQEYLLFHSLTGREDILEAMFTRQSRYAFSPPG